MAVVFPPPSTVFPRGPRTFEPSNVLYGLNVYAMYISAGTGTPLQVAGW